MSVTPSVWYCRQGDAPDELLRLCYCTLWSYQEIPFRKTEKGNLYAVQGQRWVCVESVQHAVNLLLPQHFKPKSVTVPSLQSLCIQTYLSTHGISKHAVWGNTTPLSYAGLPVHDISWARGHGRVAGYRYLYKTLEVILSAPVPKLIKWRMSQYAFRYPWCHTLWRLVCYGLEQGKNPQELSLIHLMFFAKWHLAYNGIIIHDLYLHLQGFDMVRRFWDAHPTEEFPPPPRDPFPDVQNCTPPNPLATFF